MSEDCTPVLEDTEEPVPPHPSHSGASGGTESETSDDVSEASDTALLGAASSVLAGRKRRRRTIIAADQLMEMERLYKLEQWPGREKKESLAREIGMSTHFVNIWFQNKRSRMKKLAQEEEELEMLRRSRSPKTPGSKKGSALVSSASTKPVAIAPKPTFGNPLGSPVNVAPVGIPKVTQCVVLGPSIGVSSATTSVATSVLASEASTHPSPTVKVQNSTSGSQNHSKTKMSTAPSMPTPTLRPQQLSVSSLGPPLRRAHRPQLPTPETVGELNFFKCLVSMMAVEEGGLLAKGDTAFDVAVNAALYGLRMANGNILTYRKSRGLYIHSDQC